MTDTANSNDSPICTVCIANFNGEHLIEACVDSILVQTSNIKVEIIIHDDASTDKSVDIIKNKYPFIRLIENKVNVGFCISNNRMANAANGQFLLFLNNDATLFKNAIDTFLTATQSSAVPTIYGLPQYKTDTHELIDCGAFLDPFFNAVPGQILQRQEVAMVAGACLWIPRKLWYELEGFPEWYESIAEDLYLCCRARLAGYPVIILPASGFYHLVGSSFGGGKIENNRLETTFKRRALSERNKLFTMLIIMPAVWLYFCLPILLTLLFIEGALLGLFKWHWRVLSDIYIPLIPAIYRYRAQWQELRCRVQEHKRVSIKQWLKIMQCKPYKLQMFIKYGIPIIK